MMSTTYKYLVALLCAILLCAHYPTIVVATGTVPSAPAQPSLSSVTPQSISVRWSSPSNVGSSALVGYSLQCSQQAGSIVTIVVPSNTTNYTITPVTSGAQYAVSVSAINAQGASLYSSTLTVFTPSQDVPQSPTVAVSGVTSTSATVSWSAAKSTSPVLAYSVQYTIDSMYTTESFYLPADARNYTFRGLQPQNTLTINVAAVNSFGQGQQATTTTTLLTADVPTTPTLGTPTISPFSANITWSTTSDIPILYSTVQLSGQSLTFYAYGNASSFLLEGLIPSTSYSVQVSSTNAAGTSSLSYTQTFTTKAFDVPSAPVVVITGTNRTSVSLAWSFQKQPVHPILGYQVNCNNAYASSSVYSFFLSANTTSFTFQNLQPSTQYSISVNAINAAGTSSAYTTTAQTAAMNGPLSMRTPVVNLISPTSAVVSWVPPPQSAPSDIIYYTLTVSYGSQSSVNLNGTVYNYTLVGLSPSATYSVQIQATNATGTSTYTTTSFTTPSQDTPNPPSNVRVVSTSMFHAWISWSAPQDTTRFPSPILAYVVSGPSLSSFTVPANVTCFKVTGLAPSTTYQVNVVAVNSVGQSSASYSASVYTTALAIPSAPAVSVSNVTFTSAIITWNQPRENGTRILYYELTGSNLQSLSFPGDVLSHQILGLTSATTYAYQLYAVNEYGQSTASTQTFTTKTSSVPSSPQISTTNVTSSSFTVFWQAPQSISSPILSYILTVTATSSQGLTINLPGNALQYTVRNLLPGTQYSIALYVMNESGESYGATAVVTTTTPASPTNPSSLLVTNITTSSAVLSWSKPTAGVPLSYYVLTWTTSSYTSQSLYINGNLTSFKLDALAPSTTYTVSIEAVDRYYQNSATVAFPQFTTACACQPTVMQAPQPGSITSSSIDLTWTPAASDVVYYTVQVTNITSVQNFNVAGNATNYVVTGLAPSSTYAVVITATNAFGSSPSSPKLVVTTNNATPFLCCIYQSGSVLKNTCVANSDNCPPVSGWTNPYHFQVSDCKQCQQ